MIERLPPAAVMPQRVVAAMDPVFLPNPAAPVLIDQAS
jgi:hypothetical protein